MLFWHEWHGGLANCTDGRNGISKSLSTNIFTKDALFNSNVVTRSNRFNSFNFYLIELTPNNFKPIVCHFFLTTFYPKGEKESEKAGIEPMSLYSSVYHSYHLTMVSRAIIRTK